MNINGIEITPEEENEIRNYLVTSESIKKLEKDKKVYTDKVKKIFEKYNINMPLNFEGNTLTVTNSMRKTVRKGTENEFYQKLIELGKNYLLVNSIELDMDNLYSEVQNHLIDKELVEKYVSFTPVKTLTCK